MNSVPVYGMAAGFISKGRTTMLAGEKATPPPELALASWHANVNKLDSPFSLITNCRPFLSCSTWIWELLASKVFACDACAIATRPRVYRDCPFYFTNNANQKWLHEMMSVKAKHFIQRDQLWGHVTFIQSTSVLSGGQNNVDWFRQRLQYQK